MGEVLAESIPEILARIRAESLAASRSFGVHVRTSLYVEVPVVKPVSRWDDRAALRSDVPERLQHRHDGE